MLTMPSETAISAGGRKSHWLKPHILQQRSFSLSHADLGECAGLFGKDKGSKRFELLTYKAKRMKRPPKFFSVRKKFLNFQRRLLKEDEEFTESFPIRYYFRLCIKKRWDEALKQNRRVCVYLFRIFSPLSQVLENDDLQMSWKLVVSSPHPCAPHACLEMKLSTPFAQMAVQQWPNMSTRPVEPGQAGKNKGCRNWVSLWVFALNSSMDHVLFIFSLHSL